MKECRTQTHVHCLLIFNQRDYTDCTELLLSHTEGTELTNGKVKTENGKGRGESFMFHVSGDGPLPLWDFP